MQYLYTNKPDKHCHKVKGVFGRPVQTCHIEELLKAGWVRDPSKVQTEEKKPGRDELALSLGIDLFDEDGNKLHYKLIDSAIKEAQNNVEHKEGRIS
jgi:hypothetical protein